MSLRLVGFSGFGILLSAWLPCAQVLPAVYCVSACDVYGVLLLCVVWIRSRHHVEVGHLVPGPQVVRDDISTNKPLGLRLHLLTNPLQR